MCRASCGLMTKSSDDCDESVVVIFSILLHTIQFAKRLTLHPISCDSSRLENLASFSERISRSLVAYMTLCYDCFHHSFPCRFNDLLILAVPISVERGPFKRYNTSTLNCPPLRSRSPSFVFNGTCHLHFFSCRSRWNS